ncbi:MAG: glucan ABC transporter ATP-binding protein/ permease [Bdellovibrionaceae bacterium]|nr:glucan ABC transporter ATP-binding protein/ permease [Pseudobdellovibrionaceae bacterium]
MNHLRVYWRALRLLRHESRLAISLVLAGLFIAGVQLLEPVLFGRVIDALTRQQTSLEVLATWAGLGLFNVVVSVFLAVMADRLAHRQRLTILDQVFERAISLPYSYHAQQGSGRVVRAILTGTDQLFFLWLSFLRDHLPALVGIIVLVPTALAMDWRLASLLFALAVVYLFANFAILKRTQGRQLHVENYHQDVFGRVGDVIGNVSVVQSYARLSKESQALQELMGRLLSAQYPVLTWWGLLAVITRVSSTITMVAIVGYGSYLTSRGEITVGEIVAFTGFSGLLISRLDQISAFFVRSVTQAPTLMNFFHLLDQEDTAQDSPQARPLGEARGQVVFDRVTYRYPNRPQGVFDLSFTAEAGRTVALVGPSGSGKTTTLALLQRLFDPQQGTIRVDGQDIRDFTLTSLRHSIAAVFQDSGLFNRSIAENIRVGRPEATDAEVIEAARKAEAHEFILAKPGGYDFIIGERGMALSGGERQRIAIARAILKNAPILIFDEATSALDNHTEKKIQSALNTLRANKTTFLIAHRLSTVVDADLVLVFDQGRIVESGGFQELRAAGGLFTRLLQAGELNADGPRPTELRT